MKTSGEAHNRTKAAGKTVGETAGSCDYCVNLTYDEDTDSYECAVAMDEDDYAAMMSGRRHQGCPFFKPGDEYEVVKHQAI